MAAEGGAGAARRMLGPYGVLRGNRNLQLLFGGQVVSSFGDWLYVLALGILAYEITGSATVVAVLTFARLLPYAVLLPFSGILADRGNRKVLMISALEALTSPARSVWVRCRGMRVPLSGRDSPYSRAEASSPVAIPVYPSRERVWVSGSLSRRERIPKRLPEMAGTSSIPSERSCGPFRER